MSKNNETVPRIDCHQFTFSIIRKHNMPTDISVL